MSSQGWLCRRVRCGYRNEPAKKKCANCGGPKPKKRVREHQKALRDVTYHDYLALTQEIHGVYEECAVCGRPRDFDGRRLDRDHDHTTGHPWSGKPRGLVCVTCNILMPRGMTPEKAREIAAYLTRVEDFYSDEETLKAFQELQEDAA
jgi:ribosomal protein L37E